MSQARQDPDYQPFLLAQREQLQREMAECSACAWETSPSMSLHIATHGASASPTLESVGPSDAAPSAHYPYKTKGLPDGDKMRRYKK